MNIGHKPTVCQCHIETNSMQIHSSVDDTKLTILKHFDNSGLKPDNTCTCQSQRTHNNNVHFGYTMSRHQRSITTLNNGMQTDNIYTHSLCKRKTAMYKFVI